jgi:hypothetical protein
MDNAKRLLDWIEYELSTSNVGTDLVDSKFKYMKVLGKLVSPGTGICPLNGPEYRELKKVPSLNVELDDGRKYLITVTEIDG